MNFTSMKLSPLKPLILAIRCASISAIATSTFTVAAAVEVEQEINAALSANTYSHYAIPASSIPIALNRFAQQINQPVAMDDNLLKNFKTQGLQGSFTIAQGFTELLKNIDFHAKKTDFGYIIQKTPQSKQGIIGTLALTTVGSENRFGDTPQEQGGFKADYQKTATKMAMSLKETPQAISVVTRDSLDARLVKDISTAVELTAGVSNSANGDGTQTGPGMFGGLAQYDQKFVMRGQPSSVRSDGFKVGNSNIDLAAYERVEVVKGPAGFYGQGSLGGFINMVRKKPQAEFAASINLQAGSFDTYRSDIDVTGALNQEETLNGHVSIAHENAGSFVDDIESEKIMVAPSVEAIISDNTRVLLQMLYQKDEFDANPGVPLKLEGDQITLWDALASPTKLYGATGDKSETEIRELIVKVDHQISDRWLAILLLQTNKSTRHIIEGNATSVYDYGYGHYLYTTAVKDDYERDFWAGELRVEGSFDVFGQEHKVLIGTELNDQSRHRKYGSSYAEIGLPDAFTGDFLDYGFKSKEDLPWDINRDIASGNSAIYAQTILSLQENTKLLISGRYDKTSAETIRYDDLRESSDEVEDSALTMRFGLTHNVNDNISAYAIYAESFEPTEEIASPENGGGILDPITGEGYELGLKTDWFNNKFGATLAVYRQDLTNRPMSDPEDRTGLFYVSSGLHRTEGVELELSGSPYLGLTFAAAASWMDNEFLDDDDNQGLSIDGSVDNQLSLHVSYEWQTGALQGLALGATFINVGERKLIDANYYTQDEAKQITLEGYNRADIHLTYSVLPNWDISLLIRNVTDEAYIESATLLEQGNYWGSPRAALLNVAYYFD